MIRLIIVLISLTQLNAYTIVSERIWKLSADLEIVHPEREDVIGKVFNFAYDPSRICTLQRSYNDTLYLSLINVYTWEKSAHSLIPFEVGTLFLFESISLIQTHGLSPMTCFNFRAFTYVIAKCPRTNYTSVLRGGSAKTLKHFDFDDVLFDNLAGRLLGIKNGDLFEISLLSIEQFWTRSLTSERYFDIGSEFLCPFVDDNSTILFANNSMYFISNNTLYASPICKWANPSKYFTFPQPTSKIPFFIFPLEMYSDYGQAPIESPTPIILLIGCTFTFFICAFFVYRIRITCH
jgi:hypothetical protein